MAAEVAELLGDAESIVIGSTRRYCGMRWGGVHDVDDMRQFLRIQVVRMAERYDPETGVPWRAYVGGQIRNRITDFMRHAGETRKGRKHDRVTMANLSSFDSDVEGKTLRLDPIDEYGDDGVRAVEWGDVLEKTSTEAPAVRMLALRASGLNMAAIGREVGVGESRVSQVLSGGPLLDGAKERLAAIVYGRNTSKPFTPVRVSNTMARDNAAKTVEKSSMIDQLLSALDDDGVLAEIDRKIESCRATLARLTRLRDVITGAQSEPTAETQVREYDQGVSPDTMPSFWVAEEVTTESGLTEDSEEDDSPLVLPEWKPRPPQASKMAIGTGPPLGYTAPSKQGMEEPPRMASKEEELRPPRPVRKTVPGVLLGDMLANALKHKPQGVKVDQLARDFDRHHQGIRMAARKHPRLSLGNSGSVVKYVQPEGE